MSEREPVDFTPPDSRALLAAIVSSSDDAIISKDLRGIVTSWNPAAERLFGYAAHEIVGQSILTLIPAGLRDEEQLIIGKVKAGERLDHYETTRLRKDGRHIHVSITVSPVKNTLGQIVGASKIARDIGSQREGDRASALLASIVASSDDAIISKSVDGIVTSWNGAAEKLYGYSAAEMVGTPVRRIIPAELQYEEDEILAKIRKGERIEHFETERLHKSGGRIEVSITVSPVRDSSGRVIGASKIARDVGPQREAQRQKDQFLAILAHELRNPLAPITSALAIMEQPRLDETRRALAIDIAKRQTRHMASLLDDLLDVARISSGQVELKPSRFELGELVGHAVDAVRPQMEARGHALEVKLPAQPLWMVADEVRTLQIVSNLLTNAAKYTPVGGRIRVTTRPVADHVEIRVIDNGAGLTDRMKGSLFTLFARGDDAESRSAGGLGIGLALVREFVERQGGTVEALSEGPGRGSEFIVRLPLECAHETTIAP
jgi:two-component system sensor histidine kinase VicK